MDHNINHIYQKSPTTLSDVDIYKLSALFSHETGIESFRVLPDTIYIEYDSLYYSPKRVEEYFKT